MSHLFLTDACQHATVYADENETVPLYSLHRRREGGWALYKYKVISSPVLTREAVFVRVISRTAFVLNYLLRRGVTITHRPIDSGIAGELAFARSL